MPKKVAPIAGIVNEDGSIHSLVVDGLGVTGPLTNLGSASSVIASQITDASAAGRSILTAANKTDQRTFLGLSEVDNTSDANKPISTATQAALDGKMPNTLAGMSAAFTAASAAEEAEFQSLVSGGGSITDAQARSGSLPGAAIGELRRLSDGAAAGAQVIWFQPDGMTAPCWCWAISAQSQYLG